MEEQSFYAAPERTASEEILKEYELVNSQGFFTKVLGAMTGIGAVIDRNRQIVYANDELLAFLGMNSLEPILGKRPGEVISCVHSEEEPSGCGTSRSCAYCGAINAILESQKTGIKSMKETRISSIIEGKHKSWDLNIISTPITFSNNEFYILILQDISEEKRRIALERIFFHDLLNSVGGLTGLLTLLKEGTDEKEKNELINLSEQLSRNIIDEIIAQKEIRAAENGEIKLKIEMANSIELLDSAISQIIFHEAGKKKDIIKDENSVNIDFETDKILLNRVIINLLKNGLEATRVNGTVTIGVSNNNGKVVFWVKNDQVIPQEVQKQLFQRSFSTKADGRGLGTYSIRLLTENYLEGKVSFTSNENEGTIFKIDLFPKFPHLPATDTY